jgi:hypothetical protein
MANKILNGFLHLFFFVFMGLMIGGLIQAVKNEKNAVPYEKLTKEQKKEKDDQRMKTAIILLMG